MSSDAKDAAVEACKAGYEDAVQRLTAVQLGDWAMDDTPAKQAQLIQHFRGTMEKYKQGYEGGQQTINAVFP